MEAVKTIVLVLALLNTSFICEAFMDTCKYHQLLDEQNKPNSYAKTYYPASVYIEDAGLTIKRDIDEKADVYGFYNDQLTTTGWGSLEFRAGYGARKRSTESLFNAAGFFEGFLTAKRIQQHRCNMFYTFFGEKMNQTKMEKAKTFFNEQDKWTRKMIGYSGNVDSKWRHVKYIVAQFDGLVKGYQAAAAADPTLMKLTTFDFQVLNGVGDLLDLMKSLFPEEIPQFDKMSAEEMWRYVRGSGHCSALVKLMPGLENVFMSHSSWFVYSATNRIYKHYDVRTGDAATASTGVSFSSYPGFLESLDDFYIMSNGLVLLQTTNNVYNRTLYELVKPQSLLAWQRVRLANLIAKDGKGWFEAFRDYNSGTYNNQYMIIDLNKIELKKRVRDGALWVVEQIPGLVEGADATEILRTNYWPSYNVPFFEEVYNRSGYPAIVAQQGWDFSYQLAPRAKIFRRDAANVDDFVAMEKIMRYNDWTRDPYSGDTPWGAICSRGDLDPSDPRPDGCYDTKLSDYGMAKERRSFAINGPTRGSGLGVFDWKVFKNAFHWGTPDVYNFTFVEMRPILK